MSKYSEEHSRIFGETAMEINIKVVTNGFLIEVKYLGYQGWHQYVAEDERSLLDIISKLWRDYKNDTARRECNEDA